MRAQHNPNQPLRQDADDARSDEERLDPHVDHARHRAGGVVGVDRRKHEVSRQRRVDRDVDGLLVSNFTDHDDVGILPQERSERAREREPDLRLHVDLVNALNLVLDGILRRQDVQVRSD